MDDGIETTGVIVEGVGGTDGAELGTLVEFGSSSTFGTDVLLFDDPELPEPDPELPLPEFPPSAAAAPQVLAHTRSAMSTHRTQAAFTTLPPAHARTNAPPACGSVCPSPERSM